LTRQRIVAARQILPPTLGKSCRPNTPNRVLIQQNQYLGRAAEFAAVGPAFASEGMGKMLPAVKTTPET
jgi:hypothetical protein